MKLILCIFALVMGVMSDESLEEILKAGNDQFTAKMFQEVVHNAGDKSCVMSAFSVLPPLAQLALASTGEAHNEIKKTIGFANDTVIKEVFKDLNTRLRAVKGVDLKQANKIYIGSKYSLNDQFEAISRDVFDSEVQNIDFSHNTEAAKEINAWVENNTNHRIMDLVDPDSINEDIAAMLVNAIYFKGKWKKPFNVEDTRDQDFYVTKSNKVTVQMMHKTDNVQYAESTNLDAKLIKLPYEGGDTSLVVVLPNQIDGINQLIEKIKDPEPLNQALNSMKSNEVEIALPKFKIETTTDLKDVLVKMNIEKIFGPHAGNLVNLLKETKDLYVSSATQKAFIEVNEEGAEAAATNDFGIALLSGLISEPISFTADHPFVFYLWLKDNVLFNGIFRS